MMVDMLHFISIILSVLVSNIQTAMKSVHHVVLPVKTKTFAQFGFRVAGNVPHRSLVHSASQIHARNWMCGNSFSLLLQQYPLQSEPCGGRGGWLTLSIFITLCSLLCVVSICNYMFWSLTCTPPSPQLILQNQHSQSLRVTLQTRGASWRVQNITFVRPPCWNI